MRISLSVYHKDSIFLLLKVQCNTPIVRSESSPSGVMDEDDSVSGCFCVDYNGRIVNGTSDIWRETTECDG